MKPDVELFSTDELLAELRNRYHTGLVVVIRRQKQSRMDGATYRYWGGKNRESYCGKKARQQVKVFLQWLGAETARGVCIDEETTSD